MCGGEGYVISWKRVDIFFLISKSERGSKELEIKRTWAQNQFLLKKAYASRAFIPPSNVGGTGQGEVTPPECFRF